MLIYFLFQNLSFAGDFISKNMYMDHSVLIGYGTSSDLAQEDALAALPKNFKRDPENSPLEECFNGLNSVLYSKCLNKEIGVYYRFVIPVVKDMSYQH